MTHWHRASEDLPGHMHKGRGPEDVPVMGPACARGQQQFGETQGPTHTVPHCSWGTKPLGWGWGRGKTPMLQWRRPPAGRGHNGGWGDPEPWVRRKTVCPGPDHCWSPTAGPLRIPGSQGQEPARTQKGGRCGKVRGSRHFQEMGIVT